ncbi:hypothetical protein [Spongiactinospora sp. TRM90649]|uniref:Acg family FMN-binding oxidoreductase n=1 Tax=Spongiactinospora sp. TRM90649 TaxID=3031114 RepID=UPI0023F67C8F|nr:hypothetical protein [Spongiactinospora sp. TRM90649]MDF5754252.1 hypothetical protein [Spongiactinospora sp. TRM90649]
MNVETPVDRAAAIKLALQAAVWAPSLHNTQPWIFAVSGDEISLRADTERRLRLADAEGREMLISCGAALFNLRTSLRASGVEPVVRVLPDPDRPALVARVRAGDFAVPDETSRLLNAEIERRRTHRAGFTSLPVPERLVRDLERQAVAEGARLRVIRDAGDVRLLAAVTEVAQLVQARDRQAGLEVVRWSRPPAAARRDGVPADAYPRSGARTEPRFAQRDYAWRHGWGSPDDQRFSTAPGVTAVLTTQGDDRESWITAGEALQAVLLRASGRGVSAAFHTQPLEIASLRELIGQVVCLGEHPQMIMRLGITFDHVATVRRSVAEMTEES